MHISTRTCSTKKSIFFFYALFTSGIVIAGSFSKNVFLGYFLLLRPFMHGVSSFKVHFLLILSILCAISVFFSKRSFSDVHINRLRKIVFIALTIGAGIGFLTFLNYTTTFKVPLERYSYHFTNAFHSINYFAHIHTSKAALYYLLKILPFDSVVSHYDTGYPYSFSVSPLLGMGILTSVIVATSGLLISVRAIIMRWQENGQFVIFLAYVLASAHVIKCVIDGGWLAYDFIPAFLTLDILFCCYTSQMIRAHLKQKMLFYGLLLGSVTVFTMLYGPRELIMQPLIATVFQVACYGLCIVIADYRNKASRHVLVVMVLLALVLGAYVVLDGMRDVKALAARAAEDVCVLQYEINTSDDTMIFYDRSPEIRGLRIIDAYYVLNENPLRNRSVIVKEKNNVPYNGLVAGLIIVNGVEDITLASSDIVRIHSLTPSPTINNGFLLNLSLQPEYTPSLWSRYPSIVLQNNRMAALYILNNYFRRAGIEEYILVPYYYFQVSWKNQEL